MKDNRIHKNNYARALITDTLPFDMPIIVNNEGFYSNLLRSEGSPYQAIIEKLITGTMIKTNPIDYNISKNANSVRKLSLPHPRIQYQMCEFYREYSDLICYYTTLSPISIRYPQKKSSTYYSGNDSIDSKYKGDNVERDETDLKYKHSTSFFKYKGFNRVYKFFSSGKYYALEKKFPVFWCMDVSKCFESIYTHSMSWATKSKSIIKEGKNVSIEALFGQKLDSLMQKANKNETNGIIVGPEFSRIFAEILFQDIDMKVISKLDGIGLKYREDYEVCRYIDDIFIFSKDETIAKKVFDRFSDELRKFNLHVNESKTKTYERPFLTSKSKVISRLNSEINDLSRSLFEIKDEKTNLTKIYRYFNRSNRFLDKIKLICNETNSTYDDVSSFIISSLDRRVRRLVHSYQLDDTNENNKVKYRKLSEIEERNIYYIFLVILNINFHLYSISSSVTSSYVLSRCCLVILFFLQDIKSDFEESYKSFVFNNILEFTNLYRTKERDEHLPLEIINLILITSEFGYEYQFSESYLEELFIDDEGYVSYFNAITLIYYIRKYPKYRKLHKKLVGIIRNQVQDSTSFASNSSEIHLALDVISCPYIEEVDRIKVLRKLVDKESLNIKVSEFSQVVRYAEKNPWFVNWEKINLFNFLEKKLLKPAYE